jgi:hypothetical protein
MVRGSAMLQGRARTLRLKESHVRVGGRYASNGREVVSHFEVSPSHES